MVKIAGNRKTGKGNCEGAHPATRGGCAGNPEFSVREILKVEIVGLSEWSRGQGRPRLPVKLRHREAQPAAVADRHQQHQSGAEYRGSGDFAGDVVYDVGQPLIARGPAANDQ
jgi:hypothetical protein